MKFWYALSDNLNNRSGRFVFNSSAPNNNETISPENEREEAMQDTSLALDELRAQLETNELAPEDLPFEEQILFLVRIARNDSDIDISGDDRNRAERWRDSLGRIADGFISSDRALSWQYNSDFSDAAYILDLISDDAKLRFMTDYSQDAKALFTDNLGESDGGTSFRADFYGDDFLSRQANFMNLLSNRDPEQQYIQIGEEFYVRTPQGYLGFHPSGVVGNRARVGSGTNFTVFSAENLPEQEPNLNQVLVGVREDTRIFDQIDSPSEMERLEANRSVNFYTAQSWKGFANRLVEAELPPELNFTTTLKAVFQDGGAFRQFLDADSSLPNYSDNIQTPNFSIPGYSETVTGLSSTADPSEYRDGIMNAMQLVKSYSSSEVETYEMAIAVENNPEFRASMIGNLQALSRAVPELFTTIDNYTSTELTAINEMRAANFQVLQDISPENISPEELEAWVSEFDNAFFDIISNPEGYSPEALEAQLGLIVSRILGCSEEEGRAELEQNPELKNTLLARLNTLRRRPGIEDMDAALETAQQQFYIQSTLETLRSVDSSLVEGIEIENPTAEDLNLLISACERIQEQFRMRVVNDETLSDEEEELYDYLDMAIPQLRNATARIQVFDAERVAAQEAELNAVNAERDATELLDIDTERGQEFHRTVDVYAEAIREYRITNNGNMPPTSADDFSEVSQRLQNGKTSQQVIADLQLAYNENQPLSSFESGKTPVISMAKNQETALNSTPQGLNIIGLSPSGDYILESTGTDQTTYLQSPTDGHIIAEHLTGVPDSEDLRVPPEEWATAQALAAMTEAFVFKDASELAQAGEKLGNMALVNFMRQYWGMRGNSTLPESELDKFKSLGEMMSDNHINLHTVLSQLNAVKSDETAAGNRAVDVRNVFNEILDAAAAGNQDGERGFRALLNLDNLPGEVAIESDLIV